MSLLFQIPLALHSTIVKLVVHFGHRYTMGLFQVPFRSDLSIGTGISGFSGLPANKPWAFEDAGRKPLNCAPQAQDSVHGNVTVRKGIMSDTSHYKHALHATSSMSVKLWGAGAHASSKLLTELELNKKTVHYVVICNFETESINYLDGNDYIPVLSKPARDLLVKIGPAKWADQCGTHFVAGYVCGGTYAGKATITDSSTEGSHEFAAEMGAKFGKFASGSASAGVKFDHLKEKHSIKFVVECTGANLRLAQPSSIEEMVNFASNFAQNNKGVKHFAMVLPFAAINSYHEAEAEYNGTQLMDWVESGSHLLQALNLEYIRLQRLKFVLADRAHLDNIPDAVCHEAKQTVQTALYAFDMLQKLHHIQKVNCNSTEYDQQLSTRIFVADLVEKDLGVDVSNLNTPSPIAPPAAPEPAPQPAPPEHHQKTYGDSLHSNSELAEGDKLVSSDRAHELRMQGDRNLVCYHDGRAVWSTGTHNKGSGSFSLVMQKDRNLVIYGAGHASTWSTKTHGQGVEPATLIMQNDGNIVIYDGQHKVLWSRR